MKVLGSHGWYYLVHRNPYRGLLDSPYNRVGHPIQHFLQGALGHRSFVPSRMVLDPSSAKRMAFEVRLTRRAQVDECFFGGSQMLDLGKLLAGQISYSDPKNHESFGTPISVAELKGKFHYIFQRNSRLVKYYFIWPDSRRSQGFFHPNIGGCLMFPNTRICYVNYPNKSWGSLYAMGCRCM